MKLFLDANILFSAAYSDGSAAKAVALLSEMPDCKLLTSRYAAEEARQNLLRKAPSRLKAFDHLMQRYFLVQEPSSENVALALSELPDPDDAPILAGARTAGADILVTGEVRHFGHLFDREDFSPRVMRLTDALKAVCAQN